MGSGRGRRSLRRRDPALVRGLGTRGTRVRPLLAPATSPAGPSDHRRRHHDRKRADAVLRDHGVSRGRRTGPRRRAAARPSTHSDDRGRDGACRDRHRGHRWPGRIGEPRERSIPARVRVRLPARRRTVQGSKRRGRLRGMHLSTGRSTLAALRAVASSLARFCDHRVRRGCGLVVFALGAACPRSGRRGHDGRPRDRA